MSSEKPTEIEEEFQDLLPLLESPIIPDILISQILNTSGVQTTPHTTRLLSLATQKFLSDLSLDALAFAKVRIGKSRKEKCVLTVDDLGSAIANYGVDIKKPEYFNQ
jgi:transcription initiation factor TFIID subunit 10